MEKVKVSKKVAEEIKSLKRYYSTVEIIRLHSRDLWIPNGKQLRGLPLDTLIRALYIGYEVEKTPEEKVKEYYDKQCKSWFATSMLNRDNAPDAIETVLDILGIKIEGINT